MKTTNFFSRRMAGCLLALLSVTNIMADEIALTNNVYAGTLTQGADYTITGVTTIDDWWYDPDYFAVNADGSLKFLALTGTYTIKADETNKYYRVFAGEVSGTTSTATLNADGTGAIWLIGGTGVGKPSYAATGKNWWTDPDHAICLSPIREKVYQLTLTIGKQLNRSDVNFKFFGQAGWGTEFKASDGNYLISTTSDVFGIGTGSDGHDNGNVYLKSGASLKDGDVCVFTVDCTAGVANTVMTVDVTRAAEKHPVFNGTDMTEAEGGYIYKGDFEQGASYVASGEETMNAADWYVNPDFFERQADGSLKFLAMTGRYAVKADFTKKWFNIYPIDADGNPQTMNADGTGAVYAIGLVGKPRYHNNDNESWKGDIDHAIALAPVTPGKYQLTMTVGQEMSSANPEFKLFCQPGWGKEFNPGASDQYDIDIDLNYQFVINSSSGNIYADPEAIWEDGDTYVFVLDCTDMEKAHLTVSGGKVPTAIKRINNETVEKEDAVYDLQGRCMVNGKLSQGLYVTKGKKFVVK